MSLSRLTPLRQPDKSASLSHPPLLWWLWFDFPVDLRRFCPFDAVWVLSQPSALWLSSPTRERLFAFLGVAAVNPRLRPRHPFFFFLPPAPIGHGERGGGCSQSQTLTGRRGRIGREGTHVCSSTRGRAHLFLMPLSLHILRRLWTLAQTASFLVCGRMLTNKHAGEGALNRHQRLGRCEGTAAECKSAKRRRAAAQSSQRPGLFSVKRCQRREVTKYQCFGCCT